MYHEENRTIPPDVFDEIEAGTQTMLLGPDMNPVTDRVCAELLAHVDPRREYVLYLEYSLPIERRIEAWDEHVGTRPARMAIVHPDALSRGARDRSDSIDAGSDVVVEPIPDPANLTRTGVILTDVIDGWEDDDVRVAACVHSVTSLLQYVDLRQAYQFLHVLIGQFHGAGVTAHYHLDPDAHDRQTVDTLKQLFDGVIEIDAAGDVSATYR